MMAREGTEPLLRRSKDEQQALVRERKQKHFVWTYVLECVVLVHGLAGGIVVSVLGQYVYHRVSVKLETETGQHINITNSSLCTVNSSNINFRLEQTAQQISAQWNIYFSLAGGIPSAVTAVIIVTYSDVLGRKILMIASNCGTLIVSACITATCAWNLSLYLIVVGQFIYGISGGVVVRLAASYSYVSDVTGPGKSRSFRIIFIEATAVFAYGLSFFVSGYLIELKGFTVACLTGTSLLFLDLLMVIFLLPESVKANFKRRTVFCQEMKRISHFYLRKSDEHPRCLFLTAIFVFALVVLPMFSLSVETLYLLKTPFCWSAVNLGNFMAAKRVGQGFTAICVVRLLQCCLSDYVIGIIVGIMFMASYVLEGLAQFDWMLYIAAVLGTGAPVLSGILRSIMSKFTRKGQHGAMFGGIAFVEAVVTLGAGTIFNEIYEVTVSVLPGAVFLVMAGLISVALLAYMPLKCMMHRSRIPTDDPEILVNRSVQTQP